MAEGYSDIGAGIEPRLFNSPGENQMDSVGLLNRNLANVEKQQSSFLPNALAIGALLTGNFGPMIQLQEQKRKTAIANVLAPFASQAQQLVNQGKFEEALDLANQAGSQAGARAPEIAQFFKSITDDVNKRSYDWQNLKM